MQTDINSKSLDGTQSRFARRPQTVKEWVSAICKNLNYLAMSPDCPFEEFSERDWRLHLAFLGLCFWDVMRKRDSETNCRGLCESLESKGTEA